MKAGDADKTLDRIPGGLIRFLDNGTIVSTNSTLNRMLGYADGALHGKLIGSILTGGARVFCQVNLFPVLQQMGLAEEIYFSLMAKEGEVVPVLVNAVRHARGDHYMNEMLAMRLSRRSQFEDELLRAKQEAEQALAAKDLSIAAQVKVEAELRTQAERLSIATQVAGFAVCDVDHVNDVTRLSEEAALLFGFGDTVTTVTLEKMRSRYHPDDADEVLQAIERTMDPDGAGWFSMQFRLLLPDGQVKWIAARKQMYFDRSVKPAMAVRGVLVARDITDEVKATIDLAESQKRFRSLADNMGQMAFMVSTDRKIQWVNQRWMEYVGMEAIELQNSGWRRIVDPDDVKEVMGSYLRAAVKCEPWEATIRIKGMDGQHRWFLTLAVPIMDAEGNVQEWFGTCTDVDEQIRLEEQLTTSHHRKDEFLATLAHELRNPLSPIKSGLQLMEMGDDDPAERERTRAMMTRQVDHMVRLVDDLMDLSRITLGKVQLRKEYIDLTKVINTAVEANGPFIKERKHELKLDIPAGEWPVNGDADRLAQVISNLLNNAAKYTDPGGTIQLRLWRQGDLASLSVKDNGIGIDAMELPLVFDMFAQVRTAKDTPSAGGLGLGLNIVNRLVEMHGGTITGQSEGVGKGSEFVLSLPLEASQKKTSVVESRTTHVKVPERRILVVDDNEDAAQMMSIILKKQGHHVLTAYDGEQGLIKGNEFRPEIVIMDIGMPKMNGYEACSAMRRTEWGKVAHIVALSGWGQEQDRLLSGQAGFDRHVVKPIDKATVERVVLEGPKQ